MLLSIRQGLFETNSSSVHTFSIKPCNGEIEQIYSGDLHLSGDEYGWGPDKLDTPIEKAEYLLSLAKNINCYNEIFPKVEKAFKQAGAKSVTFKNQGYIDHAGEKNRLVHLLLEDDQYIIDYLFGDGFILIDNDNNDYYEDNWGDEGLNVYNGDYGKELIEDKFCFAI